MKSLSTVLSVLTIGSISTLFGAQTSSTPASDSSSQMITPIAGPRVENDIDAAFTLDFIYFEATQTNSAYAANNAYLNESVPQGTTYYPNFQFKPGFKLGLGLNLAHDGWDLMAQYTYFHPSKLTKKTSLPDGYITLLMSDFLFNKTIDAATLSNSWKLKLDIIDLDLGRNFYISQYLAMRPFFGFKTAWNRQIDDVVYISDVDTNDIRKIHQQQNIYEIGLRTGAQTSWQFTKNWNIYGNIAYALMNASSKLYSSASEPKAGDIIVDKLNTKMAQNTLQAVYEIGMGFGYDYFFNDDNYHFGIQAGYEFQYWNSNSYLLSKFGVCGDLSLQGLDVKLRLDF